MMGVTSHELCATMALRGVLMATNSRAGTPPPPPPLPPLCHQCGPMRERIEAHSVMFKDRHRRPAGCFALRGHPPRAGFTPCRRIGSGWRRTPLVARSFGTGPLSPTGVERPRTGYRHGYCCGPVMSVSRAPIFRGSVSEDEGFAQVVTEGSVSAGCGPRLVRQGNRRRASGRAGGNFYPLHRARWHPHRPSAALAPCPRPGFRRFRLLRCSPASNSRLRLVQPLKNGHAAEGE